EKSGSTFQENVKQVRLGRAKILLRESAKNIEAISEDVGYENVEHFNRLFKKAFGMTPVQYRQSGCP
ncbi:MAG: AraC family transcriptional regulator, partial [Lachnospiraceae bacterium]|nr:AraC family transcriptional regulator [Lachnospiraceae bacterium]